MKLCSACNTQNPDDAFFCEHCGAILKEAAAQVSTSTPAPVTPSASDPMPQANEKKKMDTSKLSGWLLFFAVTKWLMIVGNGFMTVGIIATYAGQGVDLELSEIFLCGLASCAAELVQFILLKNRKLFNMIVHGKGDFLKFFFITETVSTIALCIFNNIYSGTWIANLMGQVIYAAIWGTYLYKSKRVAEYMQ